MGSERGVSSYVSLSVGSGYAKASEAEKMQYVVGCGGVWCVSVRDGEHHDANMSKQAKSNRSRAAKLADQVGTWRRLVLTTTVHWG